MENYTLILNDQFYLAPRFGVNNFDDEKELVRFIKKCESIIRGNDLYKNLITYIKTELSVKTCSILSNIDTSSNNIEIHHNVLTLFDVVKIIIEYHIKNNIYFNSLSISLEVLKIHYRNILSLIPLSTTIHEYVHTHNISFPSKACLGDLLTFYNEYNQYMTEEQKVNCLQYFEKNDMPKIELFNQEQQLLLENNINSVNIKCKVIE